MKILTQTQRLVAGCTMRIVRPSSLLESAKAFGDSIFLAALGKLINIRPCVCKFSQPHQIENGNQPVHAVIEQCPFTLKHGHEMMALNRSSPYCQETQDINLTIIQWGWFKKIILLIYLRTSIRQLRREQFILLCKLRISRRRLRQLRIKTKLISNPHTSGSNLAIVSAKPCPNSDNTTSADPEGQRLPVFFDPFIHGIDSNSSTNKQLSPP
jgi:hypothetical protein